MCLMLYLATEENVPLQLSDDLRVEEVDNSREAVRQWFSLPTVRFVGAHTHCSCGFPHIKAEEPIEYFDGMFSDGEERDADLVSLRAVLDLIRPHVMSSGEVESYPVWDGDEGNPPKGAITLRVDAIDPQQFFFVEQFLYRVTRPR